MLRLLSKDQTVLFGFVSTFDGMLEFVYCAGRSVAGDPSRPIEPQAANVPSATANIAIFRACMRPILATLLLFSYAIPKQRHLGKVYV